ncbi:YigZ family protein [Microbacterium sp. Marseille-Q6965]|uniref:YigZ family protein n=1 Tax=Microbacterium sp. Marseille-Q6965 TaxID=2965072 RepID=UPI0021B74CDC|nr:YigZ family protein [Microbacterium sp. Marseille-Q6965]
MTEEYPATIAVRVDRELQIKKSRFICHLAPASSVAEAETFIAAMRREYWDARHNCVAMVTGVRGEQARSSDDGEPAGTAGVPMLEVLRRRRMTDIVAVVTRYFGGIKLGAGGLVRAYGQAVSDTLDRAEIVHRRALTRVSIEVGHADAGRLDNLLREWALSHDAVLDPPQYAATATLTAWVPARGLDALRQDLAAWTGGTLVPVVGEVRVVDVPA